MAITNDQFLQSIYVAYWGRAADNDGFLYWDRLFEAGTLDFAGIAENFAISTEAQDQYAYFNTYYTVGAGAITDSMRSDFIDQIYQNLFNRTVDAEGKAYWLEQLKSGASSPGAFIADITYSATQAGGDDGDVISNKAAAAEYFTNQLMATETEWTSSLSNSFEAVLAMVDGNTSMSQVESQANTVFADGVLTTGVDDFTGTDNIDTFSAPTDEGGKTLDSGDQIKGLGGDDILVVDDASLGTGFTVDLGTGSNTLAMTGVANESDINALDFSGGSFSNVQRLEFRDEILFTDDAESNVGTLDLGDLGGLSSVLFAQQINLGSSNGGQNSLVFSNAPTNLTVSFGGTVGTRGDSLDFGNVTDATVSSEGPVGGVGIVGESLSSLSWSGRGDGYITSIALRGTQSLASLDLSSSGVDADLRIYAYAADFQSAVTITIGDAVVQYYANTTTTNREVFAFVGSDIGQVEINNFEQGSASTDDRLDFSGFNGVSGLSDLSINYDGSDSTITAAGSQFSGTITVTGLDMTADAANFIF